MLRRVIGIVALLLPSLAWAAVLPDNVGEYVRGEAATPRVPDAALYDEYGFEAAERAEYSANGQAFTIEAWRLRDATGAFALFQELRPAEARPSDLMELAAEIPNGILTSYGNYVLRFTGDIPNRDHIVTVFNRLPEMELSSLPTLPGFVPAENRAPNSERYILGPVSLARVESTIPPSVAAFSLGAEAQSARYAGNLSLIVFSYPTPNIARERQEAFLGLPNTLAKRAGPLVAVIVNPSDRDAAERVLAGVTWEAKVTLSEPDDKPESFSMGQIIITAFLLAGAIAAVSLLAGLGLGGLRALLQKWGFGSGPVVQPLRIDDDLRPPKASD